MPRLEYWRLLIPRISDNLNETSWVSTVLPFLEEPVLQSLSPKGLRTGPGLVIIFIIKLNR